MFTKTVAFALAAASMAAAQTHTDCSPLEKTCPANPAIGKNTVKCEWTKECSEIREFDGTTISYSDKGAVFAINKDTDAPTVAGKHYMFFGRLDVEVQPAAGAGIITSLVLQSADLDEIDWEWIGNDDGRAQSNYFGKGDDSVFDRGGFHDVKNAVTSVHKYSLEYTSKFVKWYIDDQLVRTLTPQEAKGGSRFPQTPMEVRIGTWCAGSKRQPEGTIEWGGGLTDFTKAPFNAYYKNIVITDYAGGDGPTSKDVKEYVYGDKSGSWESIKVVLNDGSSSGGDSDDKTSSSKPASTSTKADHSTKVSSSKSEETKSSESKSTEVKTTTKVTTSTTLATSNAVSSTPAPSSAAPTSSPAPSGGAGNGNQGGDDAPPGSGASALSLSSALLVGAGLFAAQLAL